MLNVFKSLDLDGSGYLDANEFAAALVSLGVPDPG